MKTICILFIALLLNLVPQPAIPDTNLEPKSNIDPTISSLMIASINESAIVRIIAYNKEIPASPSAAKNLKLLTLELLIRDNERRHLDTRHLKLSELVIDRPYSMQPNSRIEAMLGTIQGQTQPLGLKMELKLNGLTPDHGEDPYRVSCFVPVIKMKWGKVECQPSPKKPTAGEPLSLPDANAGTK